MKLLNIIANGIGLQIVRVGIYYDIRSPLCTPRVARYDTLEDCARGLRDIIQNRIAA